MKKQLPAYKDGFANGIGFAFIAVLWMLPNESQLLIGTAAVIAVVLNVASTIYTYRKYKSVDRGEQS
jgi:hypothetical protein